MEPQWGGEKSLKAAEKDHTLTGRVCAFKTSWAECRDQKRCRHRANGGDFSLDIHSYRTILMAVLRSIQPQGFLSGCCAIRSSILGPRARPSGADSKLTSPPLFLDIVCRPKRKRHDGKRGVFFAGAGEAASVGHEEIFHFSRLAKT